MERMTHYGSHTVAYDSPCDLVVIGAGASGLACAISCAQELERAGVRDGVRIVVLESASKPGRSILASGNGRCNFSNSHIDVDRYRGSSFVSAASESLGETPASSTLSWLADLGLLWREAPVGGGMLFPATNQASTVLEVLLLACDRLGIDVACEYRAERLFTEGRGYRVEGSRAVEVGRRVVGKKLKKVKRDLEWSPFSLSSSSVVLAVGGDPSDGLTLDCACSAPQGILGPLAASGPGIPSLDGVRIQARLSLPDRGFSEVGEVLFRSYGLSGIVAFNASRFAAEGCALELDTLYDLDEQVLCERLEKRIAAYPLATLRECLVGLVLPEVAVAACEAAGLSLDVRVDEVAARRAACALKRIPFTVHRAAPDRPCQVSRGGLSLEGFDPSSMESVAHPGFYALGEALDVDGPCGGYNLDWAWKSGILAGIHAGRNLAC